MQILENPWVIISLNTKDDAASWKAEFPDTPYWVREDDLGRHESMASPHVVVKAHDSQCDFH